MDEKELLEIIEEVAKDGLTELDLSSEKIKSLPAEIGNLINLTELDLHDNQLKTIPSELGKLVKLTELDLSNNQLTSLPPELGNLVNLTGLDLRNNKLSSLPAEIGKLRNLEILHLSGNYLVALPLEIGQLGKLNELYLGDPNWEFITHKEGNRLTEIPAAIGELGSLRVLCISRNQLKKIPDEIGKLTRLVKLDLKGNQLDEIPSSIGQLVNLVELNLWSNKLRLLPRDIGNLAKLKRLSISNNPLEEFPRIAQLRKLEALCLGSTGLGEIPAAIFELAGLRELFLWGNSLKELPADIKRLKDLRSLVLHENQISSLPPEIGQLTNLTVLRLNNNQLTSVPKELSQLTNLTELYLSNNQLTSVPPQLGQLTNLTRLDLSNNQLTSVSPQLGQLTNLTKLYLYKNQLASVPPQLGQLTNLTELSLYNNQLTSVPPQLGQLTNLTELYLYNNQLTSIPPQLGKLSKLENFYLEGNPLESPPPEVVEQGTQAVLAYLRELAKGKRKRYEAKLLILGDANEGKTCVSRALRDLPFEHQVTTEGVDIETWIFEHPGHPKDKEKQITLNIWDFEGQEINHQSHQFFLTKRCLYLLVFKGRERFEMPKTEYWLDTIRSRAPESEVILVATECETRTPRVPIEELRARYPDLLKYKKCFFEVGCLTGKGISALKKHIKRRSAKLEVIGTEWPESYAKAEKGIKEGAKKNAHIGRRTLNTLFNKSGINKDDYENTANLMGDLGLVTHFPISEDLKNFVVLRPQWLTKAISYVLENKQLEKDKGEITHSRLHRLWEGKYKGLSETFHKCMREFELCYDLEYRNRHLSLIPLRFGFAKPGKIPWSPIPNAKERRIEYRFELTPPAGIMSRFIVKTHYMIVKTKNMPKGVYWYNGVFLGTGEGENRSEALCEFDADKRVMSIRVRAAFPQNMVEQLNGFAQSVFEFFEGLKPERYYGCVKEEFGKEIQCTGSHKEEMITFALHQQETLLCSAGRHKVYPINLVMGLSSFGQWSGLADDLRKMLREEIDKEPKWAEEFGKDIKSILVRSNSVANKIEEIRKQGEKLTAQMKQKFKLVWRDYWDMLDAMLDNREFNSAPAVVSIVPADGSKFNPKNWFEKEYIVTPYCEYEGGVHKVDFSVKFKKPREWWQKTAPKLALGVKVLSAGIQIGCAGLPLGVDPKLFESMKNEVEFMKELAGHLELEGGAESDISTESGELVKELKGKGTLRDLRQLGGEDEKRVARMQLAQLLEQIAPKNYKARQWGPLRRVRMPDNTYRWLCAKHAKEYKK